MKTITVKSHKRKGRVVRSHSRKSHMRMYPDGPTAVDVNYTDSKYNDSEDDFYDDEDVNSHKRKARRVKKKSQGIPKKW
jgi:hypothetical protein